MLTHTHFFIMGTDSYLLMSFILVFSAPFYKPSITRKYPLHLL